MMRTFRLVVGGVVLLVASSALAQQPAGADLFPLKVGSKWVYKFGEKEVTVTVVGTEKVGTDDGFKTETKVEGQQPATELFLVKSDGVYRAKVKEDKIDPPFKMISLPAKKDTAWKVDSKVGSQGIKGEFKIIDEKAKVKVPAGEFEAILVECAECEVAGTKMLIRNWYVPGKGAVKISYTVLDEKKQENVLELKEYVEGKK